MTDSSTHPLVSVVLPTYNRAHLLPRAIASVLAQGYANFELIVADDASTDETESVVRKIADPRIRYLRCPRNGGPGYARNRGVEIAKGSLIAFQDSDDEWLADKLQRQVDLLTLSDTSVGMVIGAYIIRYPEGREMQVWPDEPGQAGDFEPEVLAGFRFIPPTWLLRCECLAAVGPFDEQLPNREDWELVFRVLQHWKILTVDGPVTIKHATPGSIEGDWRGRVISYKAILERYRERWNAAPELKAIHYLEMGRAHIQLGEGAQARDAFWQALTHRPFSLGALSMWGSLLPGLWFHHLLRRLRTGFYKLTGI